MRTDNIFNSDNIGITYSENETPNVYSHAEHYLLVPHAYLWDSDLDFYTIGVYLRLLSLCHFKRCKEDLYKYGKKEYIDNALNKLEKNNYIKIKTKTKINSDNGSDNEEEIIILS